MTKIKGMESVSKMLKDLRKNTEIAVNKGVLKTAKLIEADAKANVPVKRGEIKASIGTEQVGNTTYVFASAKHAPYQEFGTGPLTVAPVGFEDVPREFFVNGQGHTPPQPFLYPAYFKNKESLIPNIEEEVNKILK